VETFAVILGACAVALIIFAAAYVLALCPGRPRREKLRPFFGKYVAHRGLFNNRDIPENSLAAFRAAVEGGYPIELDVQLTRDGRLVVFHDELAYRMCRSDKKISDMTYPELQELRLLDTEEGIPLFSDVLLQVNERVPILIEIKHYKDCTKIAAELSRQLKDYKGEYAVQSFHPRAVAWYRRHERDVAAGLLATKYTKKGSRVPWHNVCSTLLLNFYSRPDFVSFNHKHIRLFPYRLARRLYRFGNACWTLKNQKDLDLAKESFDICIFDSFIPK